MRRAKLWVLGVVVVVTVLLAACGAPKVEWTLTVDGAVTTPLSLSYADLADRPQVDLLDVLMQKSRSVRMRQPRGVASLWRRSWRRAGVGEIRLRCGNRFADGARDRDHAR